jgi:hypothetical protein
LFSAPSKDTNKLWLHLWIYPLAKSVIMIQTLLNDCMKQLGTKSLTHELFGVIYLN